MCSSGRMGKWGQNLANFVQRKNKAPSAPGERLGAFEGGDAEERYLTGT